MDKGRISNTAARECSVWRTLTKIVLMNLKWISQARLLRATPLATNSTPISTVVEVIINMAISHTCDRTHFADSGAHNVPETCRSSDWPKDYPKFFKDQCPQAYSYAYDDKKSTFTCKANHYRIQFGASFWTLKASF